MENVKSKIGAGVKQEPAQHYFHVMKIMLGR
jgi:hypothetical protein